MANNKKSVLSMKNIVKSYIVGEEEQVVLKGIDFEVKQGEFVSILGPSGSGKSTLMNIIGLLDVPTSGKYTLAGQDTSLLNENALSDFRNKEIGFIFQSFNLLARQTAVQNVELPLIYAGCSPKERHTKAEELLDSVGILHKVNSYPNQLSGGQCQRVAIARAMANSPSILLADEPTGALDQKTGTQVLEIFEELNKQGKTIIMITHDEKIAKHAKRIVTILDGEIYEN